MTEEKRVQAIAQMLPKIAKCILLFIAIYTGGVIVVNLMDRMSFHFFASIAYALIAFRSYKKCKDGKGNE